MLIAYLIRVSYSCRVEMTLLTPWRTSVLDNTCCHENGANVSQTFLDLQMTVSLIGFSYSAVSLSVSTCLLKKTR